MYKAYLESKMADAVAISSQVALDAQASNHCIAYKGGYKFQLKAAYRVKTDLRPSSSIELEYVQLSADGWLSIKNGYAWDGPSGPTFPTKTFMRGSLCHDALYQLMREGGLDSHVFRDAADQMLRTMCVEDGMSKIIAWLVYQGVHFFGKPFADPAKRQPIEFAPESCYCSVEAK